MQIFKPAFGNPRTYGLSFKRELLSITDMLHVALRRLPPYKRTLPSGGLADELLALAVLSPFMESDLSYQLHPEVGAIDACTYGAGGAVATFDAQELLHLYAVSEDRGSHVRLDTCDIAPGATIKDARASVAMLIVDKPWVETFRFKFQHANHINILETASAVKHLKKGYCIGCSRRTCTHS